MWRLNIAVFTYRTRETPHIPGQKFDTSPLVTSVKSESGNESDSGLLPGGAGRAGTAADGRSGPDHPPHPAGEGAAREDPDGASAADDGTEDLEVYLESVLAEEGGAGASSGDSGGSGELIGEEDLDDLDDLDDLIGEIDLSDDDASNPT